MAALIHVVFFVFCLYFVGFGSTFTNLLFAFFAVSNALTMRDSQFYIYICTLVIAGIIELIYDLEKKVDSMQKIGLIMNVVFYGVNVFFVGKALWFYRKTGGIHGDITQPDF